MIDSDRIQSSYQCKKCGKILPIIGSIIPRNPNWYCSNCGTEGKLNEAFEAIK